MAVVTYLTRVSFLVLLRKAALPDLLSRGLKFVPIGILTAFVVPGLLLSEGKVNFSWQNHYLLAGVLSGLVAARWKSVFLAMGSGMLLIVVLRLIFN